jgi:hypothetical protein
MDRKVQLLLVILGAFAVFIGCSLTLIDWIENYTLAVYSHNYTEALVEALALVLYVYFGIRFFYRHFSSLR